MASYLEMAKQPAGQLEVLGEVAARLAREFLGEAREEEARQAGERLARHGRRLDREVHGGEKQCLIHGDAKSANFFYKAKGEGQVDVGVIDFQWTGAGLAPCLAFHTSPLPARLLLLILPCLPCSVPTPAQCFLIWIIPVFGQF